MLNIFPIALYLRALKQGFWLNHKLCIWARVTGQRVIRIYMSLPHHCWSGRHMQQWPTFYMGAGVRSSCLQSKYPYPLSHLPSLVVMSFMVTTQVWQRHTKQIIIVMLMEKQPSLIGDSSGRSLNTNYPVHNITWQKELCNNSPKDPQRLTSHRCCQLWT